jgi:hypothetical protein
MAWSRGEVGGMRRTIIVEDVAQASVGDVVLLRAIVRDVVPPDADLPRGLLSLKVFRVDGGYHGFALDPQDIAGVFAAAEA